MFHPKFYSFIVSVFCLRTVLHELLIPFLSPTLFFPFFSFKKFFCSSELFMSVNVSPPFFLLPSLSAVMSSRVCLHNFPNSQHCFVSNFLPSEVIFLLCPYRDNTEASLGNMQMKFNSRFDWKPSLYGCTLKKKPKFCEVSLPFTRSKAPFSLQSSKKKIMRGASFTACLMIIVITFRYSTRTRSKNI